MLREGVVRSVDGTDVEVQAETICVHGDTPGAVDFARTCVRELEAEGVYQARQSLRRDASWWREVCRAIDCGDAARCRRAVAEAECGAQRRGYSAKIGAFASLRMSESLNNRTAKIRDSCAVSDRSTRP